MTEIQLNNREITAPGLYMIKWQGRTGLARIVGTPSKGFKIIAPENGKETYLSGLPADGQIPLDAQFSEALVVIPA